MGKTRALSGTYRGLYRFLLVIELGLAAPTLGCSRRSSPAPLGTSSSDTRPVPAVDPAGSSPAPPALSNGQGRCLSAEETAKYTVVFAASAERVQSIFVGWRQPGPPRTSVERNPFTGKNATVRTTEPAETEAGPAAAEWNLEPREIAPGADYDGYLESMIPPQIRSLPHRPMKRIAFEMILLAQALTGSDESLEVLYPPSGCKTSLPLLRLPQSAATALSAIDDDGTVKLASRLATSGGFVDWSSADIRTFLAELRTLLRVDGHGGLYLLPV